MNEWGSYRRGWNTPCPLRTLTDVVVLKAVGGSKTWRNTHTASESFTCAQSIHTPSCMRTHTHTTHWLIHGVSGRCAALVKWRFIYIIKSLKYHTHTHWQHKISPEMEKWEGLRGEERKGEEYRERNEVIKGMRGKEVSDERYSIFTWPKSNV